jgi:hypothetical protein
MNTLREIIYEDVREGELYEKLDRNWVRLPAGTVAKSQTAIELELIPGISSISNPTGRIL